MARRGRGEGSIYQRPDGLWVGMVSLGNDGSGKRIRRTVYGASKTEVREKIATVQAEAAAGVINPSKDTVGRYMERWLEDVVRTTKRINTYDSYRRTIEGYIKPHLGHVPLAKLAPDHVQAMLAAMERAGKSPRMRQLSFAVLRAALKLAVKKRYITHDPTAGVIAPTPEERVPRVLTPQQAERLLTVLRENWLYTFVFLDLLTGARHGELLGLRWEDVDLDGAHITIRHTLIEQNCKIVGLAPVKSRKTPVRSVTIPASVVADLRRHRAVVLGKHGLGCPWVFPNEKGQNVLQGTIRRAFARALKRAELPKMRIHDLRHANATLLLAAGEDSRVVQARLGHSNIKMTEKYTHVLQSVNRAAADRLGVLVPGVEVPKK